MSDDGLLVPDKRIVSIDEAREQKAAERRPMGPMGDYITRKEFVVTIKATEEVWKAAAAQGVLAMGQKMYDQASEELAANFEDMEAALNQNLDARIARIYAEIEARYTWKGRWKRLRAWAREWGAELGLVAPEMGGRAKLIMEEQTGTTEHPAEIPDSGIPENGT